MMERCFTTVTSLSLVSSMKVDLYLERHKGWYTVYLEPLRHVGDSDVLVSVGEESFLQLTRLIHVVDAGLLPGLAESASPPSLTGPSLLILFLLLLSTQVLGGGRERQAVASLHTLTIIHTHSHSYHTIQQKLTQTQSNYTLQTIDID